MTAAFDYANLQDERDWCGNLPGAWYAGDVTEDVALDDRTEAIVSTTPNRRNGWWCMRLRFGKDDDVGRVRETKPFKRFLYLAFNRAITEEAKNDSRSTRTRRRFTVWRSVWRVGTKRAVRRFISAINCVRPSVQSARDEYGRPLRRPRVSHAEQLSRVADDDIGVEHVPPGTTAPSSILDVARRLWTMMTSFERRADDARGIHENVSVATTETDIDMSKNKKKTGYDVILSTRRKTSRR